MKNTFVFSFLFLSVSACVSTGPDEISPADLKISNIIQTYCGKNAKQYSQENIAVSSFVDATSNGCDLHCRNRLMKGEYSYIEAEGTPHSKTVLQENLVATAGKYRFSIARRDHSNCTAWRGLVGQWSKNEKRQNKVDERWCIAVEPIEEFTAPVILQETSISLSEGGNGTSIINRREGVQITERSLEIVDRKTGVILAIKQEKSLHAGGAIQSLILCKSDLLDLRFVNDALLTGLDYRPR